MPGKPARFLLALLLATLGSALPSLARADDQCDCERFRPMLKFDSLTDDVANVGIEALQSEGRGFALAGEKSAALRLKINTSELIPERCKKFLLKDVKAPRLQLLARGSYSQEPGVGRFQVGFVPTALSKAYDVMALQYSSCGPVPGTAAGTAQYLKCLTANGKSDFANYSTFYSQSDQAVQDAVNKATGKTFGLSDIKILKAYNYFLHATSEADLLERVASKRDGLGTQDFLTAVQMLGVKLSAGYDWLRVDGAHSTGVVTGDQLLAAAQGNITSGVDVFTSNKELQHLRATAGVCRDIATLQARMLDARGFKNTFTVDYALNEGFHVTVVTQDPKKPRQLYMINYMDGNSRADVDGPAAILQEWGDVATNYLIYKPNGGQAADITSEFGKFVSEAAGFDIEVLQPLSRVTSDMIATNVTYGRHHLASTRLVIGQDVTGARYAGVATDVEYSQNKYAPGKVGFFVGIQNRPGEVYNSGTTLQDDDAFIAYGQLEQHLKTKPLKLSKDLRLTLDSSLIATGTITVMVDGKAQGKVQEQGDVRLNTQAVLQQDSGRYHGTYRVGAQFAPGFTEVRDESIQNFRPMFNLAFAQASGVVRFKDVSLFADALVVADQVGIRGRFTVGVTVADKLAVTAHFAGRLTDDSALFEDNAIRRVGLGLNFRPYRYVNVSATGEIPIEGDDPLKSFRFFGNLGLTY